MPLNGTQTHAFDLLRNQLLQQLQQRANAPQSDMLALLAHAELQALFIWSALHGMAGIQQSNVMQHLVLTPGVPAQAEPYLMGMMPRSTSCAESFNPLVLR